MVDIGHSQTDEVLESLEKRLAKEYAQAYKEVEKKAADYFARFAEKDKAKKALVDAGKLTEKEYQTWRRNQMLTGKRWNDLRDTLAADLTNVNKITTGIVNGELNEVFAINANYSEYLIENGMRTNYGFTLYDRDTVANLVKNDPDIIPWKPAIDVAADKRWNRQMITSHITQGILQGESIPNLSKRLAKTVNNDKVAAVRTARTAVTSSQNAGRQMVYDRARDMGLKLQKEWMATLDGRTRHDHGRADGQRVPLDGEFIVGGKKMKYPGDMSAPAHLVYNCRCTTITVEPDYITKGEEPRKTYDEWIAEKGGKEYEKYRRSPGKKEDIYGEGVALNGDKYAMNPKDINGVTRGDVMSFDDANGQRGNPKYRKGTGTSQNCQSCVVANEARRRGYNVSAKSYTKNKTAEVLAQNPRVAWVDPKTGDVPEFVPWDYKKTYDKTSYRKFLEDNVKNGERYTLQFSWGNASGGHIISAERDTRGALRLYDPQTGKIYDKDWALEDLMGRMSYTDKYGRSEPPKLLRVDNLAFREDVTKDILEEGEKVWSIADDPDDWIPF